MGALEQQVDLEGGDFQEGWLEDGDAAELLAEPESHTDKRRMIEMYWERRNLKRQLEDFDFEFDGFE